MSYNIKGDLSVQRRISAGLAMSGTPWQTGKDYLLNDMIVDSGKLYLCLQSHTSAGLLSTDVTAGRWTDVTSSVVSPDTQTYMQAVDGSLDFVVDGNPVGSVVYDTNLGMPKWTLTGALDPSTLILSPVTIAQRDALVATLPLTKKGWMVFTVDGAIEEHQVWDGSAWKRLGSEASASETVQGIVELATAAETETGTDSAKAIHPAGAEATYVKKSLVDAKGDLLAGTADNAIARVAVGTDNQVLTADSTQATGIKWATLPGTSRLSTTQASLAPGDYDLDSSGAAFDITLQDVVGVWNFYNTNKSMATNAVTLKSPAAQTFTNASGAQIDSDFVMNISKQVTVLHTEVGNTYRVSVDDAIVAPTTFTPNGAWNASTNTPNMNTPTNRVSGNTYYVYYISNTGTIDLGSGSTLFEVGGRIEWFSPTVYNYIAPAANVPDASDTVKGRVELATDAEAITATSTTLAITPANGAAAYLERKTATAKGDIYVATANATVNRLAVGTDGQALVADSTQASGVKWGSVAAVDASDTVKGVVELATDAEAETGTDTVRAMTPANSAAVYIKKSLVDAKGDILVATAADTVARLAVGTDGQSPVADSTQASGMRWASIVANATAWAASTAVALNELRSVTIGGAQCVVKSTSARTTGATFDTTEMANWTLVGQSRTPAFDTPVNYIAGFKVTNSGSYYERIATGAGGATFTIGEWVALGAQSVTTAAAWAASTAVVDNEIRRATVAGVQVYIRSTSARTTGATFDATEAGNWQYIGQSATATWAASTLFVTGMKVRNTSSSFIRDRVATGTTGATESADFVAGANWSGPNVAFTADSFQVVGTFTPPANTVYDTLAAVTTGIDFTQCDYIEWTLCLTAAGDIRKTVSLVPVVIGGTTPSMEAVHGSGQVSSFIANAGDAAIGRLSNIDCHGVAFETVRIRGIAIAANGFVVPVGTEAREAVSITANAGAVNVNGAASTTGFAGTSMRISVAVPTNQMISGTPTATNGLIVSVSDALTGAVEVAIPDGTTGASDITVAFTAAPTGGQSLWRATASNGAALLGSATVLTINTFNQDISIGSLATYNGTNLVVTSGTRPVELRTMILTTGSGAHSGTIYFRNTADAIGVKYGDTIANGGVSSTGAYGQGSANTPAIALVPPSTTVTLNIVYSASANNQTVRPHSFVQVKEFGV